MKTTISKVDETGRVERSVEVDELTTDRDLRDVRRQRS